MLPLASASGVAVISVVVVLSTLFLWWLLRTEAPEATADDEAEERAAREDWPSRPAGG